MKPILFNTEMVQAILEGRKTVTRINPFHFKIKDGYNPEFSGYSVGEYYTGHIDSGVCLYSRGRHGVWGVRSNIVKPPYAVGDNLCVEEMARIFIKVTDIKVERLRDISQDWNNFDKEGIVAEHGFRSEMHHDFILLWNSTVKKADLDKYGWEANPYVWVIEFKREV